jgi:hypothetical protein
MGILLDKSPVLPKLVTAVKEKGVPNCCSPRPMKRPKKGLKKTRNRSSQREQTASEKEKEGPANVSG